MYELLDKDRVDMGFVGSLTPERSKQYDSTYITKSSYVVALPVDHPLATRDYLSFEDLRGERFISVGDAFTQHQVLVDQLRRYDMHDEIDNMYITNELMTEQGLIAAGNGVGIMIKLAVAGRRDIAMVPLRDPIDFYIYLIQKRDHQLSDFENITKQKMVEAINDLNF